MAKQGYGAKFTKFVDRLARTRAKYKKEKAQAARIGAEAKVMRAGAKRDILEGKAELTKAKQRVALEKQKTRRTIARAGAVSGSVASSAEAAKSGAVGVSEALAKWNHIIDNDAPAADGTGDAKDGNSSGTGKSTSTTKTTGGGDQY